MKEIPFLVSDNWDEDLAQMSYGEMRQLALFCIIWLPKKTGGYNSIDFYPFVAIKKLSNQGVIAYEGISLTTCMDKINDQKIRKVNVHGRTYFPAKILSVELDRIVIEASPDEILEPFVSRWK